jgi:hypothetical protein
MKLSPSTGSAYTRTHPKHWEGVVAEDIPHGWMDDMVKRLFEMINRDLIRLESAQLKVNSEKDPDGKPLPEDLETVLVSVAKKERLVAQIQRSMERLSQMEFKRQPERKHTRRKKAAVSNDHSLPKLECRIAELAAAGRKPKDSSGSQS